MSGKEKKVGNYICVPDGTNARVEIIAGETLLKNGVRTLDKETKVLSPRIDHLIPLICTELEKQGLTTGRGGRISERMISDRIKNVWNNQRKIYVVEEIVKAAKDSLAAKDPRKLKPTVGITPVQAVLPIQPPTLEDPAASAGAELPVVPPTPAKVFELRGARVMLDRDVAAAMGVSTGHLNENAAKSPKWETLRHREIEHLYRFQLGSDELENLRSDFPIANSDYSEMSRSLPWVYTAKGCYYFGTTLNSTRANDLAIAITEVFTAYQAGTLPARIRAEVPQISTRDFALRRIEVTTKVYELLRDTPGQSPTVLAELLKQGVRDLYGEPAQVKTLLDVTGYLIQKGITAKAADTSASSFGKRLANLYRATYQKEPEKCNRMYKNRMVEMNVYTNDHEHLFDQVFATMFPDGPSIAAAAAPSELTTSNS